MFRLGCVEWVGRGDGYLSLHLSTKLTHRGSGIPFASLVYTLPRASDIFFNQVWDVPHGTESDPMLQKKGYNSLYLVFRNSAFFYDFDFNA